MEGELAGETKTNLRAGIAAWAAVAEALRAQDANNTPGQVDR